MYQSSYNRAAREQRTKDRERLNKGRIERERLEKERVEKERIKRERAEKEKVERERIRDREKLEKGNPERNLDTYNTFSPKELLNELRNKESELNTLKSKLNSTWRTADKRELNTQISNTSELDTNEENGDIQYLQEQITTKQKNINIYKKDLTRTFDRNLRNSKKQSNKTINQKHIPIDEDKPKQPSDEPKVQKLFANNKLINEDKPKQQPSDEPKIQRLFLNNKPTETPNKHSSNIHKQSSKKIQNFEYEDNKNHQPQTAEEINEDDRDEDLVNDEEFITDKPRYNPIFSYEYDESSQKLLVNIFLPGDSKNIKIKDYKIMQSETDTPKMACFINGTHECDENTEVFKDGNFILRFDLPESIKDKSKEQKLNGKVLDQKGKDTGFYEVEFLF